ncbi:MAG TPA: lactate utilization protein [Pyrinomonadaceae bacterium]|jgi:L-lactate dehydrogenase complex protein LldG
MGNSEAKKAILASIRQNLAASRPFDAAHAAHHAPPETAFAALARDAFSKETLIENFRANLEFVGGNFSHCENETQAAEVLRALISEKAAGRIAVSDAPLVKRIVAHLENSGEFVENAAPEFLFESDLGVTGAQWAIAETGTLVLESESERHRLASLVPPVHVCLLEAGNVRQTLGEVLEILQARLSRTVTFVTGASRTSDIELTLAIGVHGPGELHVLLIDKREELSTDEHR